MNSNVWVEHLDKAASIEQLEGVIWPPSSFASYVVKTSHALRRKPLQDLTLDEIRLGLGQQIGLNYLVPLALELLESEPLMEASLYRGDLLHNLLSVPFSFWEARPEMQVAVGKILKRAASQYDEFSENFWDDSDDWTDWRELILPGMIEQTKRFLGEVSPNRWLRDHEGRDPP